MAYFKITQPIEYWKTEIPRRIEYAKIGGEFETQEDAIQALRIEAKTIVEAFVKQGYHTQLMSYSFEDQNN